MPNLREIQKKAAQAAQSYQNGDITREEYEDVAASNPLYPEDLDLFEYDVEDL